MGALSSDWGYWEEGFQVRDFHMQGSARQSWMRNQTAMQAQKVFELLEKGNSSERPDASVLRAIERAVDWTGKETITVLGYRAESEQKLCKNHITIPIFICREAWSQGVYRIERASSPMFFSLFIYNS